MLQCTKHGCRILLLRCLRNGSAATAGTEPVRKTCALTHRNLAIFGLATSREKRVSKNKYIYGAVCKSQPVPNPGAELTENLPETKWRAAQKQSIKKANFLFFQIFVSLVILTMPTTLWADLISLTVDSNGDTVFRGEVDRLRIIFTVDDSDAEDPYIVEVGNYRGSTG